ncbi:hypothetical protein [Magnaporthe oryzae RNA virus]|uniref:hypothetical protein n=1 Tax=Magnaporthe oryzae RNA virus TaxID=1580607 RepID=UPI000572A4D4|nr:hypothetical protein SP85_gp1 [Magnaporthe oryzae RNA virus]AJA41111.1 hypothetical protein [Magnaporthe oryzae RNA virus]
MAFYFDPTYHALGLNADRMMLGEALFVVKVAGCFAAPVLISGVATVLRGIFAVPPPGSWSPRGFLTDIGRRFATPETDRSGCGAIAPSSAVGITRRRRRARWVRALQDMLGGPDGCVGRLFRGRWTPDLPSSKRTDVQNYLLASIENGVKILGGGSEKVAPDRPSLDGLYFVVETSERSVELVFPALLGRLRQYALWRERDDTLLGALRTRAVDWCRAVALRPHVADLAVASCVSIAFEPSLHERSTRPRVDRHMLRSPGRLSIY